MKKFVTILFSFVCLNCMANTGILVANTYYFSSGGNDGDLGTSPATSWQTIAKFNAVFSSKNAGDIFLFNKGDVFYGMLIISRSGSSGLPMIISSYGTGPNPVITGFIDVVAWTNLGSNIWQSSFAVSSSPSLNMVVVNGINTAMGRYPNTGYLSYQSFTSTTITSSSLNSAITDWTNAEASIRKNNFITERDTITGHSGTVLTHTQHTGYYGINNYGFFIQNDVRTLDAQNEWYYNPAGNKIRMYSTSLPSNVQVASIDTLVYTHQFDYLTFDGLSFTGANYDAFVIPGSSNVTIQNCTIDFTGKDAVWGAQNYGAGSATNFLLTNNSINHTNNNAVTLESEFTNAVISHNTVKNTGMLAGMAGNGTSNNYGTSYGITVHNSSNNSAVNSVVEYNTVDTTGYTAIGFYQSGVTVRYNFVNHFCMVKIDGGGIYTWFGPGARSDRVSQTVHNNIVMNGGGSVDGTTQTVPLVHGYYMDDGTATVELYKNISTNNPYSGFFIHNDSVMNIHDNLSYNNGVYEALVTSYTTTHPLRNLTLKHNIFFARTLTQKPMSIESGNTDILSFGSAVTIDSNYYARPIDDNTTIQTIINAYATYTQRTLAGWQSYSAFDPHAQKSPVAITDVNDLRFEYNNTAINKTVSLGANYIDVTGASYAGSITLLPFTAAVLIYSSALIAVPAGVTYFITDEYFK